MAKKNKSSDPLIYEFTDYRDFLKSVYEKRKKRFDGFTYREFASITSFSSPSFLKHVMSGEKNLSKKSAEKITKGLKMKRPEAEFFQLMVRFNQATEDDEKNDLYRQMARNRRYRKINQVELSQFEFFSDWRLAAIWELTKLPDFKEDGEWISQQIPFAFTASEARTCMRKMIRLGLLYRDEKGRIRTTSKSISSGPRVKSLAIKNFHRQMIHLAERSIDRIPPLLRDISAVTITVHENQIDELKSKIANLRKDLLTTTSQEESGKANVYQLTVQLFPLTLSKETKKKRS